MEHGVKKARHEVREEVGKRRLCPGAGREGRRKGGRGRAKRSFGRPFLAEETCHIDPIPIQSYVYPCCHYIFVLPLRTTEKQKIKKGLFLIACFPTLIPHPPLLCCCCCSSLTMFVKQMPYLTKSKTKTKNKIKKTIQRVACGRTIHKVKAHSLSLLAT